MTSQQHVLTEDIQDPRVWLLMFTFPTLSNITGNSLHSHCSLLEVSLNQTNNTVLVPQLDINITLRALKSVRCSKSFNVWAFSFSLQALLQLTVGGGFRRRDEKCFYNEQCHSLTNTFPEQVGSKQEGRCLNGGLGARDSTARIWLVNRFHMTLKRCTSTPIPKPQS